MVCSCCLCVMVCTCWLVCHGVYLLACVSWCVLGLCVSWCVLGLCVMVLACVMLCVCHGVYLLACSMICPTHLTWGRVSMALAPPVKGLEMYFPHPHPWVVTVEATESLQQNLQEVVEACTTAIQLYHNCIYVAKIL